MNSTIFGRKTLVGVGLAGVALVLTLALGEPAEGDAATLAAVGSGVAAQGGAPAVDGARSGAAPDARQPGAPGRSDARQALAGLVQIRQRQCQMGNQLACQVLPEIPAREQKLTQLEGACRSGDRGACGSYDAYAQQIVTAYTESAAVMQAGDAGMAQMDAWRGQMNRNAANSMAALQAQGAAGQAAHQARQEMYAGMNRSWQEQQASSDRTQGRFVDGIYGGTTMHGGGVQSRVDYGSTGYTDGRGNVVAVPNGGRAPDGWEEMQPTYAVPQ